MNLEYEVKMSREDSRITSELTGPGRLSDMRDVIWRRVMDAEEEGVKQALIEMGWSPPGALAEAVSDEREACAQVCFEQHSLVTPAECGAIIQARGRFEP
jgi:hypothetical protein